jgi:hypothetical protein
MTEVYWTLTGAEVVKADDYKHICRLEGRQALEPDRTLHSYGITGETIVDLVVHWHPNY